MSLAGATHSTAFLQERNTIRDYGYALCLALNLCYLAQHGLRLLDIEVSGWKEQDKKKMSEGNFEENRLNILRSPFLDTSYKVPDWRMGGDVI